MQAGQANKETRDHYESYLEMGYDEGGARLRSAWEYILSKDWNSAKIPILMYKYDYPTKKWIDVYAEPAKSGAIRYDINYDEFVGKGK